MEQPELYLNASLRVGSCIPKWVQGAGGNISFKSKDKMWIKATGFRLDQVDSAQGTALVNWSQMKNTLEKATSEHQYADAISSCTLAESNHRPSMESGMHSIFPSSLVLHFHSLVSLLIADMFFSDDENLQTWLTDPEISVLQQQFIPAMMPGLKLAQTLKSKTNCSIVHLQNHGVILQSEDLEILDQFQQFEEKFLTNFAIEWDFSTDHLCPMRFYFPDTAIYYQRLMRILVEQESGFVASTDAHQIDPDAYEIWQATCGLYRARPQLAELPAEFIEEVTGLPTEEIRKKQIMEG